MSLSRRFRRIFRTGRLQMRRVGYDSAGTGFATQRRIWEKSNGQRTPKAPAQGRNWPGAGRAIHCYGQDVLRKLDLADGRYSLLIANPVPYPCSLSSVVPGHSAPLDPTVRDYVWRQLFSLTASRADFLDRCLQYRPQRILNCCTTSLRTDLTNFMCDNFFQEVGPETILFESEHSAVQWSTLHKTGIPVYQVNLLDRLRVR